MTARNTNDCHYFCDVCILCAGSNKERKMTMTEKEKRNEEDSRRRLAAVRGADER